MSKPDKYAELAKTLADKWRVRYCAHWAGAYCEICTAKELVKLLRKNAKART